LPIQRHTTGQRDPIWPHRKHYGDAAPYPILTALVVLMGSNRISREASLPGSTSNRKSMSSV
jgi:hypothetical protein